MLLCHPIRKSTELLPTSPITHWQPLFVHHGCRQPAPEMHFAGGAPQDPRSPPKEPAEGSEDGCASPSHACPCTPGPSRAPPKPPPGDKTIPSPLSPGGRNFLPPGAVWGGGAAQGLGRKSSARGRFSAEPVFTSTDSESKHGVRPRAGRQHPRAPLPPGAEGSTSTAERPGHRFGVTGPLRVPVPMGARPGSECRSEAGGWNWLVLAL